MMDDPIVEEIRRNRQAHAARYNNDLTAIGNALRELEKTTTRRVVNRAAPRAKPQSA